MLVKTNYTVNTALFQEAYYALPNQEMKTTINQPTGNFFYDPWVIKDEYKGTVWETVYNSLSESKGEARIIMLEPGQCYQEHADIDDRYHLNILGDSCYLINLDQEIMYPLLQDGIWYDMDASFIHTAANFGRCLRVQLVVRKLLNKNTLDNPVEVGISTTTDNVNHARFLFDNTMSSWLNKANKMGIINNFSFLPTLVKFNIEQDSIDLLKRVLPPEFKIL